MNSAWRRPSLPALAFLTWVLVAAVGFGGRFINGDGDTARHLRHGETILARGDVIRHDPFSFTKPGEAYVSFEYGAQVLLALAHRLAGLGGVVALGATLAALAVALTLRFMLRRGVEPAAAYLGAAVGAVLLATHWIARPHLFTFVLLALLLERLDRPHAPAPLGILALFTLWANLHGGWVFGMALLGAFGVGRVIDAWRRGTPEDAALARATLWSVPTAALATVLTPYGTAAPLHLAAHLGDSALLRTAHEFRPPTFTDAGSIVFLLVTIGASIGFMRTRSLGSAPTAHVIAMLGFTVGGFLARRNIPLVALTAMPLAMIHLDPLLRQLPEPPNLRRSFAEAVGGSWVPGAAAALAVWLAALVGDRGGPGALPTTFDPRVFPVEAVATLRTSGRAPRLLNEYTWGGYVLWAAPGQQVFIDPGADFYGSALALDYLRVWELQPGWREVLQRFDVEAALVPTGSPLAVALQEEDGWSVRHADGTAVLLIRATTAADAAP
jgi:hypothetical protein